MSYEAEFQEGCSTEFAELCALSTSGELSAEEFKKLDEHVAECAACARLMREYTSVVHVGMAKLAVEQLTEIETPFGYSEAKAEHRFASAIHAWQLSRRSKVRTHIHFPLG